ncbi:nucleotide-binding universal stress UspA family protein [Maribacter caenipelagi]|uniref:Nucleotide-binding universal stress UspA family protein n=1 Tax=Maribacter caenipelagi TaxID=1447781 RepID=A0A4V3E1Q3_9FLAO|nr:universal stress protein [Maribacter caenipelagi]TDS13658.1 nucleotide-binding universal stress UspA family protein [Maribacter caenipelagi]
MKNILIPTNFSSNSYNALEYAINLFNNEPCTFYILHVDELSNSDIHSNSLIVITAPKRISAKEKLQLHVKEISEGFNNPSHRFIALEEYGNLIDLVKKTVVDKKIDLIVMGTKGAKGLKASIIGSNTGNVITKVACNVLVIPENTLIITPSKIAFPTDFNLFYTYSILNSMTEILEISNAKLEVIHITLSRPTFSNSQVINKAYLHDYLKEIFTDAHSFQNILGDNIRDSILTYIAENKIEMLTMVAKNLNLFQQVFFNNSVEELSHQTSIPLFVMHE